MPSAVPHSRASPTRWSRRRRTGSSRRRRGSRRCSGSGSAAGPSLAALSLSKEVVALPAAQRVVAVVPAEEVVRRVVVDQVVARLVEHVVLTVAVEDHVEPEHAGGEARRCSRRRWRRSAVERLGACGISWFVVEVAALTRLSSSLLLLIESSGSTSKHDVVAVADVEDRVSLVRRRSVGKARHTMSLS